MPLLTWPNKLLLTINLMLETIFSMYNSVWAWTNVISVQFILKHPMWTQWVIFYSLCERGQPSIRFLKSSLSDCCYFSASTRSHSSSDNSFLRRPEKTDTFNMSLFPAHLHSLCYAIHLSCCINSSLSIPFLKNHNCGYCPWPQLWWKISVR